ncbi:MAG: C25 family cysteine peptidase, partial [Segetibacter sp.]
MKKFAVIVLLSFISGIAIGQSYYNEWIDYNKTYYKFKVGSTGLYRITPAELNSISLGNEAAQNFQLWRNGKEVALYTSVTSGALGANGYLEFWGEKNDGVTDKDLYRSPEWQLSDKESLLTDTAAFFLTVNPGGSNLRFAATANNVSGNTLPAEPYFIYSLRHNFKNRIHKGRALIVGSEYVYSSTYDIGEMWASRDIAPSTPETVSFTNLFVATNGPAATFRASAAGSTYTDAQRPRTYQVLLNNTEIIKVPLENFNAQINSNPAVFLSLITSNTATFRIINNSPNTTDRMVAGFLELNYPRQFNFTNQTIFPFTLPASATGKYLEITFNSGGTAPILYDVTNRRRYVADIASAGVAKFVIEPSAIAANLVFISQPATVAKPVSSFQPRTFVNYNTTANQGDYLIITHPSLQAPYTGANQAEQYRAYRNSAAGGSFNTKIYDIDQLTDQFGYGIKKNPLGIKNFLRYARATFSVTPKFAFLIGKGLNYEDYRVNENNPQADRLNLVPTWGYPASDILLASDNMDPVMNTLIGRISILSPKELADYLDKVKQYDQAQQNTNQTIQNKAWMKDIIHVVGANEPYLDASLTSYMRNYEAVIEDTLYGGHVINFNKTSTGTATTITNNLMKQTIENGVGLISYFGHSSSSSLDYNLDDPGTYNNTGKYPMFVVNGCNAGDLFAFDTSRFSSTNTISERFVLAQNKGSIGFIASTHFGIVNYLDSYNQGLYRSMSVTGYGKSITYNINEAIRSLLSTYGQTDFGARLHAEETTLHGDPALKMNSFASPDFVVEEPQIRIEPNIVSVADAKFTIKGYIYNIGKATGDSITIQVKHQYPDGTSAIIYNQRIRSVRNRDSLNIEVPIVASRDKGENRITVSIDTDNRYDELSEANNTATRSFIILEDELRPVYPYDLSIVNRTNIKLTASTANPIA